MVNKINYPAGLPIVNLKDEIIAQIREHQVLIVAGETGSGKTTQLPKMCLAAGLGNKGVIACTQPRRIAAMTVAKRVAEELGEDGPEMVGYKVRFLDRTKRQTRIKFLTDGMLLAEAARDRHLNRYEVIIIDEAHERSLNIDFLLGILKQLLDRRSDLKIIVSSATLDTEKFARYFAQAPIIQIPGKTYPVEVRYLPPEVIGQETENTLSEQVVRAVAELGRRPLGDILVFLPTERDILETSEALANITAKGNAGLDALVMPLFGRMSAREQSRIFQPNSKLKIVVASNVAETSVTVPGIRYVIDTGLARISSYNPRARTTKLPVMPISRASADQRKGRCGRIGPGICIRLYSEEDYLARPAYTPPEIVRANLADVILRMVDLHLGHPARFPFLEPPKSRSIKDGFNLLNELGAVKTGAGDRVQLTKRGRLMARLPLDPMIARMILEGRARHVLHEVMVIAAVLSIQDPRIRPLGREKEADTAHAKFLDQASDYLTFLNIWSAYHHTARAVKQQRKLRKYCSQNFLAYQRMREWCDIYEQICKTLDEDGQYDIMAADAPADAVHQSILCGMLRNIAQKKEKNIYQGAQGQELMIFPGSGQFGRAGQWIVAAELVETSRLYGRTVATINPQWLEKLAGGLCRYSYSNPHWSKNSGQVMALEKVTLFGLVLEAGRKKNYGPIAPKEARQIFIQAALVEGEIKRGFDFLTHNRKLISALRDVEDRVRQRHMVDEYQIYNFYDQHLPEQVWDAASLRRVLPELGNTLFMREDDILGRDADQEKLAQFPEAMQIGELRLKLFYKFEPGSNADGVSVQITQDILPHLEPDAFDWLVPGLLEEKISVLLRGLPKGQRKNLVPLNQAVQTISASLDYGVGRFYASLASVIRRYYDLEVQASQLGGIDLPDYLKMRYCLIAEDGRVVKASRTFTDLLGHERAPERSTSFKELQKKWERKEFSSEQLADLPDRVAVRDKHGQISGYAVPALVAAGNEEVRLRLCLSDEEASQQNRIGLLVLYKNAMPRQVREAAKRFALSQVDWPLFEWLGTMKEVNAVILEFILHKIFQTDEGRLVSQAEFARRVDKLKAGHFFSRAGQLFALLEAALIERRQTVEAINDFERKVPASLANKERFKDYRDQLANILPSTFLRDFSEERLSFTPRYLKALRIRVERANSSPNRDLEKRMLLAPFERQVEEATALIKELKIPSQRLAASSILAEYQLLVDEFRVSLFAQELKTVVPVSLKRLRKKKEELLEQL